MTTTLIILLAFTVVLLDAAAVCLYLWSFGAIAAAEKQRDAYKLVSQFAVKELTDIQDLLVAMVEEESEAGKAKKRKSVDRSWD